MAKKWIRRFLNTERLFEQGLTFINSPVTRKIHGENTSAGSPVKKKEKNNKTLDETKRGKKISYSAEKSLNVCEIKHF